MRTYANDEQSPVAKAFWQDIEEMRIDPLTRRKAVALPLSNKTYKPFGYKEYSKNIDNLSAYATHKQGGAMSWLAEQDGHRYDEQIDRIGDVNDGISI